MDVRRTFDMLGGKIEFVIFNTDEIVSEQTFEELKKEALRLQRIFNFYDRESELNKLNNQRVLKVSNEFLEAIKVALEYCKISDGKYDVSLGKVFLERKRGKEIKRPDCSYKDILIEGNEISLKHKDALIDLGSIAKGYIGDKIIEKMQSLGVESGLVDMRGDIRIFGDVAEKMAIQHPREKKQVYAFKLKNKAVATSGDYNQFYGGYDKSHIISDSNIASVTVVADSLTKADVLATTIFVLGEEERNKLMKSHKKEAFLVIDRDNKETSFNWFKNH